MPAPCPVWLKACGARGHRGSPRAAPRGPGGSGEEPRGDAAGSRRPCAASPAAGARWRGWLGPGAGCFCGGAGIFWFFFFFKHLLKASPGTPSPRSRAASWLRSRVCAGGRTTVRGAPPSPPPPQLREEKERAESAGPLVHRAEPAGLPFLPRARWGAPRRRSPHGPGCCSAASPEGSLSGFPGRRPPGSCPLPSAPRRGPGCGLGTVPRGKTFFGGWEGTPACPEKIVPLDYRGRERDTPFPRPPFDCLLPAGCRQPLRPRSAAG